MNVKRRMIALAAGLVALAAAAAAPIVSAQERSRTTNIATVDVQVLMLESTAGKTALAQVEAMRTAYQQDINGKIARIVDAYETLARERSALSDAAYERRLLDLRRQAANDESEVQERQEKLDSALDEALQQIAVAIEQVVNQTVKEQRLMMVLPRSTIIGTAAVPDITQDVLKSLNQRMPSVGVVLPK